MKAANEHRWRIEFSEGLSVVCLDPCPPDEQSITNTHGVKAWCVCYVGLEEPNTELCGAIDVGLEFKSLCSGYSYFHQASDCDCGWEFVITSAALKEGTG